MAWIRLDDGVCDHPKILSVGPLGLALWVAGLAYSNRNLTDGFIPFAKLPQLLNWAHDRNGVTNADVTAASLVTNGLWDRVESGWMIHDYHDFQPRKVDVVKDREANRNRQQRFRDNHRNGVSNGTVTGPPYPVSRTRTKTRKDSLPESSTSLVVKEMDGGKRKRTVFERPTIPQIRDYCLERGNSVDAEAFMAHYESNGWRVGPNPMRDWKAAVRTWERSDFNRPARAKRDGKVSGAEVRAFFDHLGERNGTA